MFIDIPDRSWTVRLDPDNVDAPGEVRCEGQVRPVDCCRNDKLAGQFALLTL